MCRPCPGGGHGGGWTGHRRGRARARGAAKAALSEAGTQQADGVARVREGLLACDW